MRLYSFSCPGKISFGNNHTATAYRYAGFQTGLMFNKIVNDSNGMTLKHYISF